MHMLNCLFRDLAQSSIVNLDRCSLCKLDRVVDAYPYQYLYHSLVRTCAHIFIDFVDLIDKLFDGLHDPWFHI